MLERFTARQLQTFVAVADSLNFTAAAKELRIAQSAVSVTVRDMESAIGATLLTRDTRNVALTPAGATMRRLASQILDAQRQADRELRSYLAGGSGELLISALPSVAATLLPPVVKHFKAVNPGVLLQVRDGMNDTLLQDVLHGRTDMGILMPGDTTSGLAMTPLTTVPLVAVLPSDHPLAVQAWVTWAQLSEHPFIRNRFGGIHPLIDSAFAQVGVSAPSFVEASSIISIASLVAAGLGVSALPAQAAPLMTFCDVITRPLQEPVMHQHLVIALRDGSEPTPAAANFLADLTAAASESAIVSRV